MEALLGPRMEAAAESLGGLLRGGLADALRAGERRRAAAHCLQAFAAVGGLRPAPSRRALAAPFCLCRLKSDIVTKLCVSLV